MVSKIKKLIDKFITDFIMWWCSKQLNELKCENPNYTIFEITGTEKDYPKYMMFTDTERVMKIMKEI